MFVQKRTTPAQAPAALPAAAAALKITTMEDAASNSGTIMLYGYIGESWTYDYESGEYEETGITDLGFSKTLDEMAAKYDTIHIRINSLGGSVYHGNAIVSAMARCQKTIETYNDGHACSMAADIWMMGRRRHMAKNAMLMVHPASGFAWGNADELRNTADYLDKATAAIIGATAASVGMDEDTMRAKYYTGKDTWLNYADAKADGLINSEDDYQAADVQPIDTSMKYADLQKQFAALAQKQVEAPEPSWLQKLLGLINPEKVAAPLPPAPVSVNKNDHNDVTIEALKEGLADGTLTIADVQAAVDAHQTATAPPPNPEVAELQKRFDDLTAEFKAFKASSGAAPSAPPMPEGDPATAITNTPDPLKAFNERMAAASKNGVNPMVVAEG